MAVPTLSGPVHRRSGTALAARPGRCLVGVALALLIVVALAPQAGAAPVTQLNGVGNNNGCIQDTSVPQQGCRAIEGLRDATDVAISPDGRFAYVAAFSSNTLVVIGRDQATGALNGDVQGYQGTRNGTDGNPPLIEGYEANVPGLNGPTSVTISPDGGQVFVTALVLDLSVSPIPDIQGTLAIFDRDADTGALTPHATTACYGLAVGAVGLVLGLTVPDCAVPRSDALPGLAAFLAPISTPMDVIVSPDGENLYVADLLSGGVARFDRDPGSGAVTVPAPDAPEPCTSGNTFTGNPLGEEPLSAFNFTSTAFLGAVLGGLNWRGCDTGRGMNFTTDVELKPGGDGVVATSLGFATEDPSIGTVDLPGAVALFDRGDDGGLEQRDGEAGCVSDQDDPVESCATALGVGSPLRSSISPDGKHLYVNSTNAFPPEGRPGPGPGALASFSIEGDEPVQLSEDGCLQQLGLPIAGFEPIEGCSLSVVPLGLPSALAFKDDGNAFLTSGFHGMASFTRDPATGRLTQDPIISPKTGCTVDGPSLTPDTSALALACQLGKALNAPVDATVFGENVYVPSGGAFTGIPAFAELLGEFGITGNDAVAVFGPSPVEPPEPPAPPPPPGPTPAPTPPPPPSVEAGTASVSGAETGVSPTGEVTIPITCARPNEGDRCTGTLHVETAQNVPGRTLAHSSQNVPPGVRIGRTSFNVPAGQTQGVTFELFGAGKAILSSLTQLRTSASVLLARYPADTRTVTPVTLRSQRAPAVNLTSARTRLNRRGRAPIRIRCRARSGSRCTGRIELRVGRSEVGQARINIRGGRVSTVQVRLNRLALGSIRRNGRLRVRARATSTLEVGVPRTATRRITINRARARARAGVSGAPSAGP
jgi:hypothetical protein